MFAVVYQGYLKAGKDEEYQHAWKEVATYFIQHRGAIGSCLHRGENGLWLAYSRWPDRAKRDASWPSESNPASEELPDDIRQAIATIKECIDPERKMPDICLDVVHDLFLS